MATYWDPFQEMDRLFGSLATSRNTSIVPMDLFREGDHYVLAVDLPGIDPGSIDVSCEDRMLTIRAERTPRSAEGQWLLRERSSGTVARQVALGRGLALDKISASYADGVLTLTIPVAEDARPRRIEVAHDTQRTAIEAGS